MVKRNWESFLEIYMDENLWKAALIQWTLFYPFLYIKHAEINVDTTKANLLLWEFRSA